MEKLREYFSENRDQIDTEVPSFGHFNRFNKRLDELHKRDVKVTHLSRYAIVASLFIAFFVGYFLVSNNRYQDSIVLGNVSTELNETQEYFEAELSKRYKEMDGLVDKKIIVSTDEILSDIDEMDDYYKGLQTDLAQNPNDERIINAMIMYYQQKIEMLDMFLNQAVEYTNNNDVISI